jgi:hypothetical protein
MISILPCNTLAMDLPLQENTRPSLNRNSIHKFQNQQNVPKHKRKRKIEEGHFKNTEEDKENKKKGDENIGEKAPKRQKVLDTYEDGLSKNSGFLVQSKISNILKEIEDSHKAADWVEIYNSFISFHSLNYSELEWKALAQNLKAYRWPSQKTWKDTVGGHLFFPSETIEWEQNIFESFHLRRIDMLWSFAVGAKFNNSLSKYYLVRVLDRIRSDYTDAPLPLFFKKLYTEAFLDLKKSVDNPDACYVIGSNYMCYPYLSTTYVDEKKDKDLCNIKKAIKWHKKGADLKNKFQVLEIKAAATATYSSPTEEEYLSLASKGYIPAYVNALSLEDSSQRRKEIRKEAVKKGYKYFLPDITSPYKGRKKLENAREAYLKAGRNNISHAYIMLGSTYVDDIFFQFKIDRLDLKKLPSQNINKAIDAFTLAGNLKNPEGWEYLSTLYQELYEQKIITQEEYRKKILYSLEEGVKLGSAYCYHKSYHYLPQKAFDFFIKNYGYPPQMELRYNIEAFLNKKY